MIKFQAPGAFATELRAAAGEWLKSRPSGWFADRGQWLWSLSFLGLLGASYGLLLALPVGPVSLLLAVGGGALAYVVIAAFCHDASHGTLHRHDWVNDLAVYLGFAVMGIHGPLWRYRHLKKHDPFPNVEGSDVDADGSVLIRLSPHKPWLWFHRFQPLYAPFLYALVLVHVAWVEDFMHWRKAAKEAPAQFTGPRMWASFFGAKAIHLAICVAIPMAVLQPSLGALLVGYLLATGTASLLFVLINVGSHITDVAEFPKPDETGRVGSDWATHQLTTAIDWSPTNTLFIALTGGANAHAAHHLFPGVAHCHNAGLSRIVARHAGEHGLRYHLLGFGGMLSAHWRHLRALALPAGAALA